MKHIRLPLTEADITALQAGDEVLLSGPLYTARDAAHQRLCRCLQEGKPLPVELAGETIYYVGPSPAKPGEVIGSAGPTTSYRMDPYTPPLLALGWCRPSGSTEPCTLSPSAALRRCWRRPSRKKHPCATRIWDRRRFAGWRWRISTLS